MLISNQDKLHIVTVRIKEAENRIASLHDTLNLQKEVAPDNIKLLSRTEKMIEANIAKKKALEAELDSIKEML